MKKILSVLFSLVIIISASVPFTAFASDSDYVFSNKSDGTLEISQYTGSDTTLLIPATSDGKLITGIGMAAFYMSGVVSITFPYGMKSVGQYAFESSNLNYITFNEGLETIETHAFGNCTSLKELNLPSTVTTIEDEAITAAEHLSAINVAEGNTVYTADGVALYDAAKTRLILYAVFNSTEQYTLPSTLETIGGYSFSSSSKLKTIGIPASVKEIQDYAFVDVSGLTDVWYAGSETEWEAVKIGTNNTALASATMHYGKLPPCTTHSWGDWTVTTKPTCTEKGEETRVCSVCEETEKRDVDPSGHTSVTDAAVPATCTESGLTEGSHCSVCKAVITAQETVDALGHNYGEWTVTTKPTCTEKGEETRICSRCKNEEKRDVEPTGVHTWNDGEETKAATCTEDGETTYTCTVCGATKTEPIPSEGAHKWNDGEVTTEPTCVEKGVKTFTCTVCSAIKTEPVEATGVHTEVVDKAVPATFSKTGLTKGSHCYVCGAVLTEQKTVAKLGAPKIVKLKMNKKGLTIKWKTVKKVHGYKIQISTSKKFKKSKTKTFTVRDQKQAKRLIKRYRKGKYYVRIRAYKVISGKKYYSKWSKAKSVKRR